MDRSRRPDAANRRPPDPPGSAVTRPRHRKPHVGSRASFEGTDTRRGESSAAGSPCRHPAAKIRAVSTWGEFQAQQPEFAERVRALFDAHKHKTIATLRADGSPRI